MNKVFITTISFNNNAETISLLDSLENVNKNEIELSVVVIDNASKEKFKNTASYKNFKLEILRSEENLGFAGGQNLGIKHALEKGAETILILNNDITVDSNFLTPLISLLKRNAGIISPKIYFTRGHEYHKNRYKSSDLGKVIWYAGGVMDYKNVIGKHIGVDEVDMGQYEKVREIDFATGCCVAVKKEVFEKIGFFDERYFLYYEDNDFSLRAKEAGFSLMY